MDIIMLLKQVPKPKEMRVDEATGTLDRTTAPSQMNQDCQHALEMALHLKEQHGGRVIVVSMGPPTFQMSHITALERGVDETVLLSDRKLGGSDTWATGYALAETLRHIGYSSEREDWIILGGRQTTDGDTAHVPSQVAENLGIPQVTLVEHCEISDGMATVRRIVEGGSMHLRLSLPCMLSIAPTAPALRGRSAKAAIKVKRAVSKDERGRLSFKEGVDVFRMLSVDDVGIDQTRVGLDGSPTIVAAAPKVEQVTRDLCIADDAAGLVGVVEGWR